ncbi:PRC-barrel domain-containing protein [Candidatus Babeliales bacterium]|nr:PRC-barrel domain-containing protein [Candidatus Babeliales bacterium]MCF7910117.1 PRC-barrel domain-containing protein [Candidatus Pacearchaeota archaeon]
MRIKKISDVVGLKVYTDSGDFFGQIEEANLLDNRVDGWKIKVGGEIMSLIGGAKGVIIPQQFVKAISDIFIISKAALPSQETEIDDFGSSPESENLM